MKNASPPAETNDLLTLSDEAILAALYRYYYLTAIAVCRLLFRLGSLTYAQTKLKRLNDLGLVHRLFLPRPTQHGSAPSVYCLSKRGLDYVAASGVDVPRHYQPIRQQASSYLFLRHSLTVSDVLITAELLCRQYDSITLNRLLHELDLKRTPFRVEDSQGNTLSVVPDGYVDLTLAGKTQACIVWEVDRGTEEAKKYRSKIRGLVEFSKGAYQSWAGTRALTIAVITTSQPRLAQLQSWTEAEIEVAGNRYTDLFRLSWLSENMLKPDVMWCEPTWQRPFDHIRYPLIQPPY